MGIAGISEASSVASTSQMVAASQAAARHPPRGPMSHGMTQAAQDEDAGGNPLLGISSSGPELSSISGGDSTSSGGLLVCG